MSTKLQTVGPKTDRLMMKFAAHRFAEAKAGKYASHGFGRRIQTVLLKLLTRRKLFLVAPCELAVTNLPNSFNGAAPDV